MYAQWSKKKRQVQDATRNWINIGDYFEEVYKVIEHSAYLVRAAKTTDRPVVVIGLAYGYLT